MAKNKANIDDKTLAELKKLLLEKRKRLQADLENFAKKTKDIKDDFQTKFPQVGDHYEENTTEVEMYEDDLGVEHSLEKDLAAVDEALDRMEKGTYGTCDNCGEVQTIDIARLKAFPEAKTCIKCQPKSKNGK